MKMSSTLAEGQGVVISKSVGQYRVQAASGPLVCGLGGRVRAEAGAVVVGDVVRFAAAGPGAGTGQIVAVLPRRNTLSRREAAPRPGTYPAEQVIAANVDLVVPVLAVADPPPQWNLLDRYLTLAESRALPALICLTKADLIGGPDDGELAEALAEYRGLGYPAVMTSALSGAGLDELRQALSGRVSVLLGKSGVGKTSLLNALEPSLGLRTAEVSGATGKGRHATSQAVLVPLAGGGALVDTPGTREFGLWDVDAGDLALFFPEMRRWLGACKFGLDCRHDEEPGCAIRQAVMDGHISPRRYQSYMRLRAED